MAFASVTMALKNKCEDLCMVLVIPGLERLKQVDPEVKAILGYLVSLRPVMITCDDAPKQQSLSKTSVY